MRQRYVTQGTILSFEEFLKKEEKSLATIKKYIYDVKMFSDYVSCRKITKQLVVTYKSILNQKYAVNSVNSKLASLNSLFNYLEWHECRVKGLKIQRRVYISDSEELSKTEYFKLIEAAKNNLRLQLIIETICCTGIRISELCYFTVENVKKGSVTVDCKNKIRNVIIPEKLKLKLIEYADSINIESGLIFTTRNGNPINRSNIWSAMKKLCKDANIDPQKVFPHNLRKLFARTFYNSEKDIAKLADVLGHSNINTTRIYIMSTGLEHRQRIEQLGLIT